MGACKILVSRELLNRCLKYMESSWEKIDVDTGPTSGGIDAEIAKRNESEIAELRAILLKKGG